MCKPNPTAALIDAVGDSSIDVAIAWGTPCGSFVAQSKTPLLVAPLTGQVAADGLPLAFSTSMAVRRSDAAVKETLDQVITRRVGEIRALLARYHVPIAPSLR